MARFLGLQNLFPAKVVNAQLVEVPFGVLEMAGTVTLPAPGSTGTVLIQSWGIQITENGCLRARVIKRSFHGSY